MNTWKSTPEGLYKQFEFSDFKEAFGFMKRVADLAEQQQHHPTWKNTWNIVEIWLISHEAGDTITDNDYAMATAIDTLFTV
ncbi:MAG: 4a-hydroxytetrahydrobiopterin dehydratase [Candidatus Saccharimonadales bacterium]